jgi:hypothetical protein
LRSGLQSDHSCPQFCPGACTVSHMGANIETKIAGLDERPIKVGQAATAKRYTIIDN